MARNTLSRALLAAPLLLSVGALAACNDSDVDLPPVVIPTPTPTPTSSGLDVTRCLQQNVAGSRLDSVQGLIIPDTLTIDFAMPSGFPNGRDLDDQVIDLTLGAIFLQLEGAGSVPVTTFASIPLNPAANDVPLRTAFPYLAPPQGTPPLAATTGTTFDFRTEEPTDAGYVRVDRMGMPAVSTALIGSATKNAYNDGSPASDASGTFTNELVTQLTGLTNALADDLGRAGLPPCAQAR